MSSAFYIRALYLLLLCLSRLCAGSHERQSVKNKIIERWNWSLEWRSIIIIHRVISCRETTKIIESKLKQEFFIWIKLQLNFGSLFSKNPKISITKKSVQLLQLTTDYMEQLLFGLKFHDAISWLFLTCFDNVPVITKQLFASPSSEISSKPSGENKSNLTAKMCVISWLIRRNAIDNRWNHG